MNKNLETLSAIAKGKLNQEEELQKAIRKALDTDIYKEPLESIKKLAGEEHVDHPSHYNRPNSMECIDEMVLIFGREATMNFCLLNSWKYRYRAADKNGAEDIAKSDWYIAKYKELKESDKCQCNCHKEESKYMSVPAYESQ